MDPKLLKIGFGNSVVSDRVIAILTPVSSGMKRLRDEARDEKRLIDATQGRKTLSIILTDSNHVILSAYSTETMGQRYIANGTGKEDEPKNSK
jgi:extracellular matrix regulatory protein A